MGIFNRLYNHFFKKKENPNFNLKELKSNIKKYNEEIPETKYKKSVEETTELYREVEWKPDCLIKPKSKTKGESIKSQKFGSKGNLSGLKEDNIREYREIQFEETKKIIEDEIRQLQLIIPSYAVNPNIPIYLKRQEYWNKECCASCLSCSDDDGRPLRCVKHNVKNHKNGCCDGYRYYNIQIPGK